MTAGGQGGKCISPRRLKRVLMAVETATGRTAEQMLGLSRRPPDVQARWLAIRILCEEVPGTSTPILGRIFGNRDHTTIMYAIKHTARRIGADPRWPADPRWREAYQKARAAYDGDRL